MFGKVWLAKYGGRGEKERQSDGAATVVFVEGADAKAAQEMEGDGETDGNMRTIRAKKKKINQYHRILWVKREMRLTERAQGKDAEMNIDVVERARKS